MKILVTGGAGYIASHTNVVLLENGYEVVAVDNLSNSSVESIKRVEQITHKKIKFYQGDVGDKEFLDKVFAENKIHAVIHFAGLKAVGESCEKPLLYYQNNLMANIALAQAMSENNVKRLVFSSSATVYGVPKRLPLTEKSPLSAVNPYGATKLMGERIFSDLYNSDNNFHIVLLRYFNPVGAHESGMIGEDPKGIPNNLMPYISQVAIGKLKKLKVFGNDYATRDGTGVRDYIHVMDLARAHLKALEKIDSYGVEAFNVGTGEGYSVLEMVKAFEKASGKNIPYEIAPRRPGDVDECFANCDKAKAELGFVAEKNLTDMCADLWRWQTLNPNGYDN
ncbi:MAG: UDP-glucose 4-epimerase GalE [Bacillota bacterium]|jgi:UDP-glucose 4-epimerase|nr:UDP-glucose 4-epimerase GalE [Bacillota bacterium]HHU43976.1 UDP-glucose 4-epimerase GalE [Clostridiales bacterium]